MMREEGCYKIDSKIYPLPLLSEKAAHRLLEKVCGYGFLLSRQINLSGQIGSFILPEGKPGHGSAVHSARSGKRENLIA